MDKKEAISAGRRAAPWPGLGALVRLHEGHAFLEEEVGEELLGLVFLAVGGSGLEGGDGGIVVTGLHQGLAVKKLGLTILGGEGHGALESSGGTYEVLVLHQGSTLADICGGNEIFGFDSDLLLTVAFGHTGGLLQGLEGLVVLGLVDLLLGDGNQGLGNDLLALGDHFGGLFCITGLELGEGALELSQGLDLVGFKGLGAHVEGFHSGAHVLGGSDSSGECERRDGDK